MSNRVGYGEAGRVDMDSGVKILLKSGVVAGPCCINENDQQSFPISGMQTKIAEFSPRKYNTADCLSDVMVAA
jgi:hypothetical protein